MTQALINVINTGLLAVFFSEILFMGCYAAVAKWRKTAVGRSLMTKALGMVMITAPTVLNVLFDVKTDSRGYAIYVIASLGIIIFGINWRTAILVREQYKNLPAEAVHEDTAGKTEDGEYHGAAEREANA